MQRSMSAHTNFFFITALQARNYEGQIHFNHRCRTLTLEVRPQVTETGEGAKDLKSLSGGERSFSTVCFIMALWESIQSPFRCLDEFDVFMVGLLFWL
jgi:chromosome segregation ATPase